MGNEQKPSGVVDLHFEIAFFNSPYLWKMACEMLDEAKWVEKQPTEMSSRAIIAVILAAAASEAFINELAAEVQKIRDLASGLVAFGSVMREIEDARGSLALKYLVASHALSGKMFDRGAQPFQDVDLLRRLRDLLIHVKSPDLLRDPPSSSSQRLPLIVALRQKGLTYPLAKGTQTPWFNELQTYKLAAWACDISQKMILAVLALIPDGRGDPSSHLKQMFRGGMEKE